MKPPICRVCGIAHWGSEHVWPRGATAHVNRVKPPAAPGRDEPVAPLPAEPSTPSPDPALGLPDADVLEAENRLLGLLAAEAIEQPEPVSQPLPSVDTGECVSAPVEVPQVIAEVSAPPRDPKPKPKPRARKKSAGKKAKPPGRTRKRAKKSSAASKRPGRPPKDVAKAAERKAYMADYMRKRRAAAKGDAI